MHLRRGQAEALGVLHRLGHVGDQAPDLGGGRVGDRVGGADQDGVAHAGDLQDRHSGKVRRLHG